MSELNGYQLSRKWFDFCFENPEKIRPTHTAIYMFALEHWNRLGQKRKFGFPSQMTMDAIGIKSYNTYIPCFNDLVEWGFFELIEKSKNQYSSNIIALSKINKAPDKSLDKAFIKHSTKQVQSTSQSKCSIIEQGNKGTKEQGTKDSVGTKGTDFPDVCEFINESKQVANYLLEAIKEYDPTHKYNRNPPSLNSWILDIERAMRLDGRTEEQLKFIIDYVYRSNGKHSSFWAGNIESGNKLRKQFDKIKNQIRSETVSRNGTPDKLQEQLKAFD